MLQHYFKVTFREQLKYKTQAIVSIIGLAIGFTAFILGATGCGGKRTSITSIPRVTGCIA